MSQQRRGITLSFDWEEDSVPVRVVEAVATAQNREMTELEPLADSVDPDALAALFSGPGRNRGSIRFGYANSDVVVYAHGEIVVD